MGWFKKLFVSNLPEEEAERESEMDNWAAEVPAPLPEPVEEPASKPVVNGVEREFLHGTTSHVLFTENGQGDEITGHGYTEDPSLRAGDWVLIKGVTGNILRYLLTRVEWPGEPPTKFEYDAVLDMPRG
jgi:hypothetical protein